MKNELKLTASKKLLQKAWSLILKVKQYDISPTSIERNTVLTKHNKNKKVWQCDLAIKKPIIVAYDFET